VLPKTVLCNFSN